MRSVIAHILPTNGSSAIDAACNDLFDYCQLLDDHGESDACWHAYNYLKDQHAQARHDVECGVSSARMERLQQLVRQLTSEGDVRDLLYALQPLARLFAAREQCEQQGVVAPGCTESNNQQHSTNACNNATPGEEGLLEPPAAHGVVFPGLQPTLDGQRITSKQKLLELFAAMDDDLNGRINASQFRAAMEMLGDDLHGQDVATIFDSFDIDAYGHGVDFETFQNIVEAEGVRSHGPHAEMLRRLHLHPRWWTPMEE